MATPDQGYSFQQLLDDFQRGYANIWGQGTGGLMQFLGVPGGPAVSKYWQDVAKANPMHPSIAGKNLIDNPEMLSNPIFWMSGLTEQTNTIPLMFLGGGAGGKLAAKLGMEGWKRALMQGVIGGGIPETMPEFANEIAQGMNPWEARARAIPSILGVGALNALPMDVWFGGNKGSLLNRVFKGGLAEGLSEWAEEPTQALAFGHDPIEAAKQGLNVLPIASVMGGGMSVLTHQQNIKQERAKAEYDAKMKDVWGNALNQAHAMGLMPQPAAAWNQEVPRFTNFNVDSNFPPGGPTGPTNFKYTKEEPGAPPMPYTVRTKPAPRKTVKAYKLLQTKKNAKGEVFPLFIGAKGNVPIGEWLDANFIPTKGYANRPGWHFGSLPYAPHLMKKDGRMPAGRVWAEVEIGADRTDWQDIANQNGGDIRDRVPEDGYYNYPRPESQGKEWKIAGTMKVNRILTDDEVGQILQENGLKQPEREGGPANLADYGFREMKPGVWRQTAPEGGSLMPQPERPYPYTPEKVDIPPMNITRIGNRIRGAAHSNQYGDFGGSLEQVRSNIEILKQNLYRGRNQLPEIRYWYEQAGDVVRELSHGDKKLQERIVKLLAILSPQNNITDNWKETLEVAYEAAKNGIDNITKTHLNMSEEDIKRWLSLPPKYFTRKVKGIGAKMESFYRNLHDSTFQKNDWPMAATMDLWMAKMMDYMAPEKTDTGETVMVGKFASGKKGSEKTYYQYELAADTLREAVRQYNEETGDNLLPRQAQAMLWAEARRPTMSESEPMTFADVFQRSAQNVTVEAVPSMSTREGEIIDQLSAQAKQEYTKKAFAIFEGEIMDTLGIPLYSSQESTGGYAGAISPNYIISIPSIRLNGNFDTSYADAVAATLQYVLKQDAVPYFRADPALDAVEAYRTNGAHVGFRIEFKELTPDVEAKFFTKLQEYFGEDAGYTKLPGTNSVAVINYMDESGYTYKLDEFLENNLQDLTITDVTRFGTKSEYPYHDWTEDPEGRALRQRLETYQERGAGRPDLLRRVDDWRAQEQALIEEAAGQIAAPQKWAMQGESRQQQFMAEFKSLGFGNPFDPSEVVIMREGGSNESGAAISIRPWGKDLYLSSIRSLKRGEGNASNALNKVLALADKHGQTIYLEPVPYGENMQVEGGKRLTRKQLEKWYGRHGFEWQAGQMVRQPVSAPEKWEQTAFHGTGAKPFEQFSIDKVGSGEGAQVYGWGLYFTDQRDVAKWYRNNLGSRELQFKGVFIDDVDNPILSELVDSLREKLHFQSRASFDSNFEEYRKELLWWANDRIRVLGEYAQSPVHAPTPEHQQAYLQEVLQAQEARKTIEEMSPEDLKYVSTGNIATVDLLPQEDEYLLWDEPIKNQSQTVKDAISKLYDGKGSMNHEKAKLAYRMWDEYASTIDRLAYANNLVGRKALGFSRALYQGVRTGSVEKIIEARDMLSAQMNERIKYLKEGEPHYNYSREETAIREIKKNFDFLIPKMKEGLNTPAAELAGYMTGQEFYNTLAQSLQSEQTASLALLKAGIRGNKYWNGQTRHKDGRKEFNFVLFDDNDVKIEKWNLSQEAREKALAIGKMNINEYAMRPPVTMAKPSSMVDYLMDGGYDKLKGAANGLDFVPAPSYYEDKGLAFVMQEPGEQQPVTYQKLVGPYKDIASAAIEDVLAAGVSPSSMTNLEGIVTFVPEGENANTLAFFAASGPYGGNITFRRPPFLAINADTIETIMQTGDIGLMKKLRYTLAHELGHALEIGATNDGDTHTAYSPLFKIDPFGFEIVPANNDLGGTIKADKGAFGPLMQEMVDAFVSDEAMKDGFNQELRYPLMRLAEAAQKGKYYSDEPGATMKSLRDTLRRVQRGKGDFTLEDYIVNQEAGEGYGQWAMDMESNILHHIKGEIFAQAHALYFVHPQLLKKHAPQMYKFVEEAVQHGNEAISRDDLDKRLRKHFRSKTWKQYTDERGAPRWAATGPSTSGGVGLGHSAAQERAQQLAELRTQQPSTHWNIEQPGKRPKVVNTAAKSGIDATIYQQTRGVQPNELTKKLADGLGVSAERVEEVLRRQLGESYNAEEIYNVTQNLQERAGNLIGTAQGLVEKLDKGTMTDADYVQFNNLEDYLAGLTSEYFGVRAESGRALQIQRKLQDSVGLARALREVISMGGGKEVMAAKIRAMAALTPEAYGPASKAAAKSRQITKWDMLIEYYKAMLLTGPQTHVVNTVGNETRNWLEMADNYMTALIGKITGSKDALKLKAANQFVKAHLDGLRLGFAASQEVKLLGDTDTSKWEVYQGAIPGKFGRAVRIPYQLLGKMDALQRTAAYHQNLLMEAVNRGMDPDVVANTPKENLPKDMVTKAEEAAARMVYMETPGDISRLLKEIRKRHPWMNFIVPFINTPANIAKDAIRHTPVVATIFSDVRADLRKGGRARDVALARQAMGGIVGAVIWMLAAAGKVTGSPPKDPTERRMWQLQGKQPFSIKMGDTWYAYNRMDPFGIIFGLAADAWTLKEQIGVKDADDIAALVSGSIANNLTNKTYLSGLSDVIGAINDPARNLEYTLKRFAGSLFVPTAVATVARVQDPYIRQAESIMDAVKARVPFMSQTLPQRLDVTGEPIKREGGIGNLINPIWMKTEVKNPVAQEIIELDVNFPAASKKYRGVELNPNDYNDLVVALGKNTYTALKRVVGSAAYKNMPDNFKKYILQKVIDKTRRMGRLYWSATHPEIMKEVRKLAMERKYGVTL